MAINPNRAGSWIVETQDHRQNGAFTGTAGSDQSDAFARLDAKIKALHSVAYSARIPKSKIIELDKAANPGQDEGFWFVLDRWFGIQNSKDLHSRFDRALHRHMNAAQRLDRIIEEEDSAH